MFIKLVPTEVHIFIRNFLREQAWERWLGKSRNGMVTTTQKCACQATTIARARTEQEYVEKVSSLKESYEWRSSSNFRNYISKTWLPQHKVTRIRTQICALHFFFKNILFNFFFSTFFIILIEMGMGFTKRPSPHNNKCKQWCGEIEQGL